MHGLRHTSIVAAVAGEPLMSYSQPCTERRVVTTTGLLRWQGSDEPVVHIVTAMTPSIDNAESTASGDDRNTHRNFMPYSF